MLGFLEKRKLHKQCKESLQAARHARNMREDIADPQDLAALQEAEDAVRTMRQTGEGDAEKAIEALDEATEKIYSFSNRSGAREWIEVLIVAIGAAMAIRAFFFQPYKIPTGSMQPTLNGILVETQTEPTAMDRIPFKFFKWIATGASYKEIRAKASGDLIPFSLGDGQFTYFKSASHTKLMINIGGTIQTFPSYMKDVVDTNKMHYEKDEIIAYGKVIAGDHILVNKMKYNFMSPERGDIAVFDTRNVNHPDVRKDTFYIKRMVGMPGEKIQIKDDHYLMADGEIIEDPPIFKVINESPRYAGHTFGKKQSAGHPQPKLMKASDVLELGENEYLMMGDNTENSLDGRYFGGVPRRDFQGSAFFVYWPFREHWGLIE